MYSFNLQRLFVNAVAFRLWRVTAESLRSERLLLHLIIHVLVGGYAELRFRNLFWVRWSAR